MNAEVVVLWFTRIHATVHARTDLYNWKVSLIAYVSLCQRSTINQTLLVVEASLQAESKTQSDPQQSG